MLDLTPGQKKAALLRKRRIDIGRALMLIVSLSAMTLIIVRSWRAAGRGRKSWVASVPVSGSIYIIAYGVWCFSCRYASLVPGNKALNVGSWFVNVWLTKIGDGWLMVDCAFKSSYPKIMSNLERFRIAPTDIKYIFLTHAHQDHAGCLEEVLSKTGATLIASPEAVSRLRSGLTTHSGSGTWWLIRLLLKRSGQRPRLPPLTCERIVEIQDLTDLHHLGIPATALRLPGHTDCSIGISFDDGNFFVGDAVFNAFPGKGKLPAIAEDMGQVLQTWRAICDRNPRRIFCGHGPKFLPQELLDALARELHRARRFV